MGHFFSESQDQSGTSSGLLLQTIILTAMEVQGAGNEGKEADEKVKEKEPKENSYLAGCKSQ